MKTYKDRSFTEKIQRRIRLLRMIAILMLVYMVFVGELGGGDSRKMASFATNVCNLIFFGGFFYVISRIRANKKLLNNPYCLEQKMLQELDERNRHLHDKSGGVVMDILLAALLFITVTAGMFNMAAFYTSVTILAVAVVLKIGAYWVASRCGE